MIGTQVCLTTKLVFLKLPCLLRALGQRKYISLWKLPVSFVNDLSSCFHLSLSLIDFSSLVHTLIILRRPSLLCLLEQGFPTGGLWLAGVP